MFTIRGLFQDFQQFGQQAGNRILVLCRVEVAVDDGFFVRSDTAFDDRFEERMQGHPSALCDAEVVEEQCCGAMPCIIRKSKCSTDFKRNDFLKKNEAYPLGALRSLKFAYRKLRISLFVELAV